MKIIQLLLSPFSLLYHFITKLRNISYDSGLKRSYRFEPFLLSVGNLTVGGTGKSPHIEYLVRLLMPHYQVAVLSGGYKRKSKGYLQASPETTAAQIGDEPMQFYRKFGQKLIVSVHKERILGVPDILADSPDCQVILLDDAFQHRQISPDLQVLLCDYNRPFYKDFILPSGRLRESRSGAKRADIVVVSKCPTELGQAEMTYIRQELQPYIQRTTPIFFSGITYDQLHDFQGNTRKNFPQNTFLLTGIANTLPLLNYLTDKTSIVEHLELSDHYAYNQERILRIINKFKASGASSILTTEKDAVKLMDTAYAPLFEGISIYYLPIKVLFLEQSENFDALIQEAVINKMNQN